MKVLDINNMLDAATNSKLPGRQRYVDQFEVLANELARALADHLKIALGPDADYQPGFGGLCANFKPKRKGQKCPKVIDEGDEGGEWEL
ncbi:hypothetical protein [Bradyrhizobium erythrophlei]|uniref:Uncharacterized protein n=1 Tax=Bradyrhizobium erythrophlei TaxID=1437360 RepID=A0A1M5NH65_9BRAD|nr:hypothetical protein [Bradyrhizobium erythrophlei]SHG88871.1 hypothetical protein SAMN05443248_2996 [Bradyrhizobium erythrophlei]